MVAAWLGTSISASTVARVMGINLVSSIILQIEPMLLAGLAAKGILSLSQVGRVATIELATLAIVMTWSVARLPYTHVRKYCMLAALVALTANFITAWLTSVPTIYGVRALSGGASGIFLWTIIGIITRSGSPARLNGINISVQCAASLVAATIFSSFVIPHFGAGAGFTILGALGALVFLTTFSLPRTFDPPSLSVEGGGALGKSGWIALLSVFLSMAAVLSIWVYIPSLAVLWGYPDWAARSAVPFGIGMEACGGLAVVLLSRWIGWRRGLTLSLLTVLLIGLALSVEQSPVIYIAATGAASFRGIRRSQPPQHGVREPGPVSRCRRRPGNRFGGCSCRRCSGRALHCGAHAGGLPWVHGNRHPPTFAFNNSEPQNEIAFVTVRMTHILSRRNTTLPRLPERWRELG